MRNGRSTLLGFCLVGAALVGGIASAQAKPTLHFSARERSACRSEAIRFCTFTYPNKRDLVNCLQAPASMRSGRF